MSRSGVSISPPIAPSQVWEQLPVELKVRAIRCLAHLAWTCATTSTQPQDLENGYECAIHPTQDRLPPS